MRLVTRLAKLVQTGRLTLVLPDHRVLSFGEADPPPNLDVVVQLCGAMTPLKLGRNPEWELGEAYADHRLELRQGGVGDLMELLFLNLARHPRHRGGFDRLRYAWISLSEETKTAAADRGDAILRHNEKEGVYRAFLGEDDPQFSVAYFDRPDHNLERAQAAGRRYALAAEQLLRAREAVRKAALADRVRIEPGDYRSVCGVYDRIVITGAFEHVGAPQYRAFFRKMTAALAPDGGALVHSTGHAGRPRPMNPWVRRRLFPDSHAPALDLVTGAAEGAGLRVTDLEILRLHGAETLRLWRERFAERSYLVHDEYRRRAWEFFLAAAEMAFAMAIS